MPVYGLVSFEEAAGLERSLARVAERFKVETLRILEIGVHDGRTSRGIRDYLSSLNITNVENWAIDIGLWAKEKPYPEMRMIWGDSAETFHLVPLNLHWVFVDGCHCINHAMADVAHFGRRLMQGGEMVVHDTFDKLPLFRDYQEHGPRDRPEFHILGTRMALTELGLLPCIRQDYKLVEEVAYPDYDGRNGIITYEKLI